MPCINSDPNQEVCPSFESDGCKGSSLNFHLVTGSHEPIVVAENIPRGPRSFSTEDEGNNIAVWGIKTGHFLRTFPSILPEGEGAKKQMAWPALKWSPDDKYTARLTPGQQISAYELPSTGLAREEESRYSTFLAERFPAKNFVQCLRGNFLCVRVDRHTKTKKSIFCNLEIFRVREKDFPVEVVELKDSSRVAYTVTEFSWEPKDERFAIVSSSDPNLGNPGHGVTIKTDVSFYQLSSYVSHVPRIFLSVDAEPVAGTLAGCTTNTIRWSPHGRHVVLATVGSTSKSELEFGDLDFNSDDVVKKDPPELGHPPALRGGPLWGDGRGMGPERAEIEKPLLDRFKQLLWRSRAPSLLTKEQKRTIRRNLKEYARAFGRGRGDVGQCGTGRAVEAGRGRVECVARARRGVYCGGTARIRAAWWYHAAAARKEKVEEEEDKKEIEVWIDEVIE
ncbi:hypothetical protein EDB86DRAFT_3246347 [Lactarius hatsudake]|nr:hypothetical protein EDB86DRAFT_3246347 [Lactarius hatsudake]